MSGYQPLNISADNHDGYIAYSVVSLDHNGGIPQFVGKRRASKIKMPNWKTLQIALISKYNLRMNLQRCKNSQYAKFRSRQQSRTRTHATSQSIQYISGTIDSCEQCSKPPSKCHQFRNTAKSWNLCIQRYQL